MIIEINQDDYNKAGIYKIANIINNKIYIGSAYNLKKRFDVHKSQLKNNKHNNGHLQKSYNKYGSDNFKFCSLEIIENVENIISREQNFIDLYFDGGIML